MDDARRSGHFNDTAVKSAVAELPGISSSWRPLRE
jgi:hypothetical protein